MSPFFQRTSKFSLIASSVIFVNKVISETPTCFFFMPSFQSALVGLLAFITFFSPPPFFPPPNRYKKLIDYYKNFDTTFAMGNFTFMVGIFVMDFKKMKRKSREKGNLVRFL